MNLDLGVVALILGVVGFYIRLIMSQRRKTREWQHAREIIASRKKGKKNVPNLPETPPSFGTFSRRKRDWAIGAAGYVLMMVGVAIKVGWLHSPNFSASWWFPVMVGIYLFSWFFN